MQHLPFDSMNYPYTSRRTTTVANNGMVATTQPLASQAGFSILKKGGNAVDAAIATAAALTVVEPTSNGIGGDAFSLVWMKDKLYGLNASGPAPKDISVAKVRELGHKKMPSHGWIPVTVPGVPGAWAELSNKFGKLPLTEVLKPAIIYAEKGFPVSPTVAYFWDNAFKLYKDKFQGKEFNGWFETFAPNGRSPLIGEVWHSKGHAETLRKIAGTKAEAFYKGELADQIDDYSREYNGFLRKKDLEAFKPEWVEPLSVNYRGYDVWELPPNGQGLIALNALNILKHYESKEEKSVAGYHQAIEAIKLAFADGQKYITDRKEMKVNPSDFLTEAYGLKRRQLIGKEAMKPEAGKMPSSGTVYLATADSEGNMVSYIQSNYRGFGSGLVVPGTGIALQNRGEWFSLNPEDANVLKPGKHMSHTIIPGFLTKNNRPLASFGVMGGPMQPQGHVQVLQNILDHHLNPQAALDAPRWQWLEDKTILVETDFPKHQAESLSRLGRNVKVELASGTFGRGQMIWRDLETGTYFGGTDGRADGTISAY